MRFALICALSALILCYPTSNGFAIHAQSSVQNYTVLPGDTLGGIADRFNISVDQLVQFNGIADPNLIAVGQILRIPGIADLPGLEELPTARVRALPGETIETIALRFQQDPPLLSQLNNLSETARLFPDQAVEIPLEGFPPPTLKLGAIHEVAVPTTLVQGKTGHVFVSSTYSVALSALWNGLPLHFSTVGLPHDQSTSPSGSNGSDEDHPSLVRQTAFLPVPALLAPQPYLLEIVYTTRGGYPVRRQWQISVIEGPYDSQVINLAPDTASLLEPEIVQAELAKLVEVWQHADTELLWTDRFLRPLDTQYPTTSPFGTRRSYNGGPYSSYHAGQDFGAPEGITIVAPAAGVVALAESLQVRGNAIVLDHGRGVYSGYWHLSDIQVSPGQRVAPGDVLGLVGTTGLSTGAHLHWELRIYGIAVDPMQFIESPLLPD